MFRSCLIIESKPKRDPLINPLWIEDKALKGPMTHLSENEMQFWKDMLDKYLHPIDENKEEKARISAELKELRNKAVFSFFMFNALFILIVFLLQLHKDNLYLNWPIGAKTNITYNDDTKTVSSVSVLGFYVVLSDATMELFHLLRLYQPKSLEHFFRFFIKPRYYHLPHRANFNLKFAV